MTDRLFPPIVKERAYSQLASEMRETMAALEAEQDRGGTFFTEVGRGSQRVLLFDEPEHLGTEDRYYVLSEGGFEAISQSPYTRDLQTALRTLAISLGRTAESDGVVDYEDTGHKGLFRDLVIGERHFRLQEADPVRAQAAVEASMAKRNAGREKSEQKMQAHMDVARAIRSSLPPTPRRPR